MRTTYLFTLIAALLFSVGCSKPHFTKIEKVKILSSPVFGEDDSTGNDYGTGEVDIPRFPGFPDPGSGDNDNSPGEGDAGVPNWNPNEPDWTEYRGSYDHNLTLVCSDSATRDIGYNLLSASSLELRFVDKLGNVVCKNSNTSEIKNEIISNKKLPLPSCSLSDNKYALRLVDPTKELRKKDLLNFKGQDAFIVRKDANSPWTFIDTDYRDEPTDKLEVLYNGNNDTEQAENDTNCDRRSSPLIIKTVSEDVRGIELSSQANGILFDILGENSNPYAHAKKRISWITKASYQFVVKPNSRGRVEGINEMFGDNTKGPDSKFAEDGYAALAKYDLNKDRVIDSKDAVYADLKLWSDKNFDGKSQKGELISLKDTGLVAVDLEFDNSFHEEDQYGNQTKMKSVVKYSDGSYKLIFDLWFNYVGKRSR